jgi:hypothetical protein
MANALDVACPSPWRIVSIRRGRTLRLWIVNRARACLAKRNIQWVRENPILPRIERAEGQSEQEDHAAILLEIMAGLASGSLGAPTGTDREFFGAHLGPWITLFISDLERSPTANFYASVGALG